MLIAVIGVAALAIVGLWLWLLRRRRPAPAIVSAPAAPGPRRGCSAIHDVRFEPPFNDIEPYAVETPPGVELDLDAAGPAVDGVELRPLRAWLDEAPLDPEIALGLAVGVAGLYALEERDFGPRSIDADDNAPRALDAVIDALEAGRAGDDVVVAIGTPELVLTSVADRVSRNISAVKPTGPVITPAEILFWALFGQSWASWQANPVGGEVLGLPSIERVLCGALLGPSRYPSRQTARSPGSRRRGSPGPATRLSTSPRATHPRESRPASPAAPRACATA